MKSSTLGWAVAAAGLAVCWLLVGPVALLAAALLAGAVISIASFEPLLAALLAPLGLAALFIAVGSEEALAAAGYLALLGLLLAAGSLAAAWRRRETIRSSRRRIRAGG